MNKNITNLLIYTTSRNNNYFVDLVTLSLKKLCISLIFA